MIWRIVAALAGLAGLGGVADAQVLGQPNNPNPPTASSCGTSPSVADWSTNNFGLVTTGTGTPTACTVTFAQAFPDQAACVVSLGTAVAVGTNYVYLSAVSKSAFTASFQTGTNSVKIYYWCQGN